MRTVMDRKVEIVLKSQSTVEGAGVRLKRVFGYYEVPTMDPFLLLDHFGSDNPADYVNGFPWHPHRGIETVTYMWSGEVEHGDSMGNSGVIKSGDVQWMTAGSGIIHQEMPKRFDGLMRGFQLWVNLPAKKKMTAPKYRGIESPEIPTIQKNGLVIKVLCGKIEGVEGPVKDLSVDVEYLDVKLNAGKTFERPTQENHKVFAYVVEGFIEAQGITVEQGHCAVFGRGDTVGIGSAEGAHFLFVSGEPLKEPIAWGGPIVMNTEAELAKAFEELDNGTFIKAVKPTNRSKGVKGK
jgi:redox-sensitive bicupin YhaK (pirin superfamily)